MKKRIVCFLLAVVMTMSLSTGVLAAEGETGLSVVAERGEQKTTVEVSLTAEGATNGRIVVSYDSSVVKLLSAQCANPAWIYSINTKLEGQVSFAWAGSDLPAAETCMLVLYFENVASTSRNTGCTAELIECYDSGKVIKVDNTSASAEEGEIDAPDIPDIDVPTDPSYPEIPEAPSQPENPDTPDTPDTPVVDCPFTDIDHWAKEYILKAYAAGIVNGTSATTFSPEATLNRAMFVTLLYRLSGSPAANAEVPFTDVGANEYYADAVAWAYANGIVTGTGDTTFSPAGLLSREQMVTMLYRYAKYSGRDVSAMDSLGSYTDAASVSNYAYRAMQWAVAEGYITGYAGKLNPAGSCKRAEAATVLVRYAGL